MVVVLFVVVVVVVGVVVVVFLAGDMLLLLWSSAWPIKNGPRAAPATACTSSSALPRGWRGRNLTNLSMADFFERFEFFFSNAGWELGHDIRPGGVVSVLWRTENFECLDNTNHRSYSSVE